MDQKRSGWLADHGVPLLILAVVFVAGSRVLGNGFFNYDDPQLLLERAAAGGMAPTWHNLMDNLLPNPDYSWQPLRFLLQSLVYTLAGLAPWAFHLVSLLLYAMLCLLMYLLAHRLLAWDGYETGGSPWKLERANFWPLAAGLIFATSPLNVESLAWVSASKDLLHGVFWLAFLLSVLGREGLNLRGNRRALLWLALALLAKPSAVVLPLMALALLLLGPYSRDRASGLPLKAASAAGALVAAYMLYLLLLIPGISILPSEGGVQTITAGALKVMFAYVGAFLAPVGLSVRYLVDVPLSVLEPSTLARLFTLLALLVVVFRMRRGGRLLPSLAVVWYLLALLPSSGVVPLEILRADRYALPLLPVLAIMLSYGLRELGKGFSGRKGAIWRGAVLLVPLCFGMLFIQRLGVWKNSESLWSDALAQDSRNWIALNGLAHVELERGDTTAAIAGYEQALEVNPTSALAMTSLATLLEKRGQVERAGELLLEAGRRRGGDLKSSLHLARFYLRNGQPQQAAGVLEGKDGAGRRGAELNYLWSIIGRRTGRLDEAVARMKAARSMDLNNAQYQAELGRLYLQQGKVDEALLELGAALDEDNDLVEGYLGFGELFTLSDQPEDAANAFYSALSREPDNRDALLGLAGLYGSYGQLDSAAVVLDRLLASYPGDCGALANRVALLVATGKMSEAEQSLQAAVECDSMLPQNYINGYRIYAGLDDLGQAAVMLERVEALAPDNPQVEALKADMEKITGIPADTLTHYLAPYARSESIRVTAAEISVLLDSLRHIQH